MSKKLSESEPANAVERSCKTTRRHTRAQPGCDDASLHLSEDHLLDEQFDVTLVIDAKLAFENLLGMLSESR